MQKEKAKDGRAKNGGARPGAGRKPKVHDAENCLCKKCVRERARKRNIKTCRGRYQRIKASPDGVAKLRDYHLRKKYGISLDDYNRMHEAQNGLCAICGEPEKVYRGSRPELAVDHCHETGRVRGLLCNACNRGIGNLRDDVGLLRRALAYLDSPPAAP